MKDGNPPLQSQTSHFLCHFGKMFLKRNSTSHRVPDTEAVFHEFIVGKPSHICPAFNRKAMAESMDHKTAQDESFPSPWP
jgi:hypothetical protein